MAEYIPEGEGFKLKSQSAVKKVGFKAMGSSPVNSLGAKITGTQEKGEFVPDDIDYGPPKDSLKSPNNLNNFGIGPGSSPWKAEEDSDKEEKEDGEEVETIIQGGGEEQSPDHPGVKAGKIGIRLLSGALSKAYGGPKYEPKINWGKYEKEAETTTKSPTEGLSQEILGQEVGGTTYNPNLLGEITDEGHQMFVSTPGDDNYSYRRTADGNYEYSYKGGDWVVAKGKGLEAIKKRYEKDPEKTDK